MTRRSTEWPTRPTTRRPTTRHSIARAALASLAAVSALGSMAACSTSGNPSSPNGTNGSGPVAASSAGTGVAAGAGSGSGTLNVLAAASLTEAFGSLAKSYEASHPGTSIRVTYGSSATLVQQANSGAPADIVATAGTDAAAKLDPSLVKSSVDVAQNTLEIAVPTSNPGHVTALSDLANPALKVVLCATSVPCGSAADTTLAKAGVTPNVVSRETDVKATLTKVRLGEADAAIVYHSDIATAAGQVTGIAIPSDVNQVLHYPVVVTSSNPMAADFASYVAGPAGTQALAAAGFQAP